MTELTIVTPSAHIEEIREYDAAGIAARPFALDDGIAMLRSIERSGRKSHRSEDKQTTDSWERFLRTWVMGHGDWSLPEKKQLTVEFEVDRGLTHEIVRHRIGQYTQESTRFVNYTKREEGPRWILPLEIEALGPDEVEFWKRGRLFNLMEYDHYISDIGVSPENARGALGHFLAAQIDVTYNLRQWRHFFIMRTSRETHRELRRVTVPLLEEFKQVIPIFFEDIVPEQKQSEMLKLAQ